MAIEIRGAPADRALRTHVTTRLRSSLAHVTPAPTTAQVTFFDENGPKGGLAMRCALTVRVPFRPHLRAEDVAETYRTAFDGAVTKLERELERTGERRRESKRYPKKYYTAKRLMAEGSSTKLDRRTARRSSARRRTP